MKHLSTFYFGTLVDSTALRVLDEAKEKFMANPVQDEFIENYHTAIVDNVLYNVDAENSVWNGTQTRLEVWRKDENTGEFVDCGYYYLYPSKLKPIF